MSLLRNMVLTAGAMLLITTANAGEFKLSSRDIGEGQMIGEAHVLSGFGCSGKNISPALTWSDAPEGTKSFVVTAYDPDAPTGSGWWHWVVYDIPADVTELVRNAGSGEHLPQQAAQARTDFGTANYGGPCPPEGAMHRYQFTIHALGVEKLDIGKDASPALIGFMMHMNTLASARITAIFKR